MIEEENEGEEEEEEEEVEEEEGGKRNGKARTRRGLKKTKRGDGGDGRSADGRRRGSCRGTSESPDGFPRAGGGRGKEEATMKKQER